MWIASSSSIEMMVWFSFFSFWCHVSYWLICRYWEILASLRWIPLDHGTWPFLVYCCIQIASILLMIFEFIFISHTVPYYAFLCYLCLILVSGWLVTSQNEIGSFPFSTVCRTSFNKIVLQLLSCVRLFATPWTAAHQASLCFTVSRSLFKLVSIEFVMPSNHLILCCPLLLLPSNVPSITVFSNELTLHMRGQSIGASASASVFPMNIQGWFPSGLTGPISLQSKGLSRVFSSTTIKRHRFFSTQPSVWSSSHIRTWLLEKP